MEYWCNTYVSVRYIIIGSRYKMSHKEYIDIIYNFESILVKMSCSVIIIELLNHAVVTSYVRQAVELW